MRQATFKLINLLGCIVFLASMATIANAQFKAGIQGTVTDNAGAIVADANVTLTNKETNQTQQTKTSDGGFYRFSGLAPGLYTVTVEKDNFKKQVVEDVTVSAETLEGVDISLQAGGISETVTVTAETAQLETEDANIRKTITTAEILTLPQNGRNPYELARLTPGVFGTGARSADGSGTRLPNTEGPGASNNSIFATEDRQPISANGQRVSSNNFQIDGSSVNSQTWGGGAVITPSQESVKEVQITSSTYSAEDGRNSGAQIKVVSQNGTNDFRGSAFFKINDPALNSFNKLPRNIGVGPRKVEQKYKSFGGSFGGAIVKDRLFFFFAYEGLSSASNNVNPTAVYVETASFRQQVISARAGTLSARILGAPGILPRIASITTPRCSDLSGDVNVGCAVVGDGLDIGSITGAYGSYVQFFNTGGAPVGGGLDGIADLQKVFVTVPSKFRGNQYNTRVDWNISSNDQFTVSSYIVPNTATTADYASQGREMADLTSKRLSYALGFIYRKNFSATMLNEARFNITRWGYDETKSNPNTDFGLPRIEIESLYGDRVRFGAPRSPNTPGVINERQFEFRDVFTKIFGNHALKIGGEYRRDLNSNGEVGGARPLYSFKGLWNFANGTPIFEEIVATQNGTPTGNNTSFHTGDLGFFVQDDWKFRPNLTLNMGLRWQWFSPITADNGELGNLILDSNGGLPGAVISTQKTLTDSNFTNFAPQLGFAYSPNWFGENKLVIRGGGGIGFDRLPNALLANARRNPPNGSIFSICCGTNGTTDGFGTPFVDGLITFVSSSSGILGYPRNPLLGGGTNPTNGLPLSGAVEIYGTPRDLPDATVYRYSLEGQYQLPLNLIGTVGYQGSQGRHFIRILPVHLTTAGGNPNIDRAFFASPDVNSNYNALITRLQGRFTQQLSFDMNYRWAKSIDTTSYESPTGLTNQSFPVDQSQERGPSDFDVRHAYVGSATWEPTWFRNQDNIGGDLLSGWSISSIVTWNSGFPWTPRTGGCLQQVNTSRNFCDPRPTQYYGRQPLDNSNENFLNGGIFPGSFIGGNCGAGAGCNRDFLSVIAFNANPFSQLPGIGRNVFRGPRYFNVDLSLAKRFDFGEWGSGVFGENAKIDLRFNFFNIFNNLNLAPFNANTGSTRVDSADFGKATTALSGRVGEFQIRFSF